MSDLELMTKGERILWKGKPKFSCFILETIFNFMLVVAIIWGALDFFFIRTALNNTSSAHLKETGIGNVMWIFFLVHLMPVWIYLGGVITSIIRYKHTEYIVTERGIYVSGGVISKNMEMKPFTDLAHITIHRGFFDNILGVGDVVSVCSHGSYNGMTQSPYMNSAHNHMQRSINICDIADYQEVFTIIKNAQTDVYADTMYPNAYRPDVNPGYRTSYTPDRDYDRYNNR